MKNSAAGRRRWPAVSLAIVLSTGPLALPVAATAQTAALAEAADDPRVGLAPGWRDAGEAAWNMTLVAHRDRPAGFFDAEDPGSFDFANSDLAFRDDLAFVGNYAGFNIYDISDPTQPRLRSSVICPGGQGDVSIYEDLLFVSVEQTRGRIDCGVEGAPAPVDPDRFRGVRIFDVSDLDDPVQVAAVQTCRGSHTHTLVPHPDEHRTLYVYVSGTSTARPAEEMEGCVPVVSPDEPNTSYWSIAVIEVPLDEPQAARVVNEPRVFADPVTGSIAGLWPGGAAGPDAQETRETIQCHDITAYPSIGLAAGACSGNGILFDISDPVNPVRIDEVFDPNFAYWHSATFSNDGTTVIFTDEWGGGSAARCQAEDPAEWGANAIFEIVNGRLRFAGYYKLPAPQTATENCVAHNGSLVPVPGRDIKVQSWYQGGISVLDFTDPAHPYEIAFFDRGPLDETELMLGGFWSTYWYNGYIYGSEIARGFDVLELTPSEHLSQNEIDAARLVLQTTFNPQHQPRLRWPPAFAVARAYLDQLIRGGGIATDRSTQIADALAETEAMPDGDARRLALAELATAVWADARRVEAGVVPGDESKLRDLSRAILDLAADQS